MVLAESVHWIVDGRPDHRPPGSKTPGEAVIVREHHPTRRDLVEVNLGRRRRGRFGHIDAVERNDECAWDRFDRRSVTVRAAGWAVGIDTGRTRQRNRRGPGLAPVGRPAAEHVTGAEHGDDDRARAGDHGTRTAPVSTGRKRMLHDIGVLAPRRHCVIAIAAAPRTDGVGVAGVAGAVPSEHDQLAAAQIADPGKAEVRPMNGHRGACTSGCHHTQPAGPLRPRQRNPPAHRGG